VFTLHSISRVSSKDRPLNVLSAVEPCPNDLRELHRRFQCRRGQFVRFVDVIWYGCDDGVKVVVVRSFVTEMILSLVEGIR